MKIMGSLKGGRIWNTGPYSSASSAKSAGMLPVRRCLLPSIFRSFATGICFVRADRRNSGPAMLCPTASAMARPIRSILQICSTRSSDSSSSSKMNLRTSQVWMRPMMTMSLGSGISLLKMALLMRVLTNSTAVPTSDPMWSPILQADPASDQKSPSWCCRIFRSVKRSRVMSMIDSASGASLSIQYWALR